MCIEGSSIRRTPSLLVNLSSKLDVSMIQEASLCNEQKVVVLLKVASVVGVVVFE